MAEEGTGAPPPTSPVPPSTPPPPTLPPTPTGSFKQRVQDFLTRAYRNLRDADYRASFEDRLLDLLVAALVRARKMTGRVNHTIPRIIAYLAEPISVVQLYLRSRCNYLAAAIAFNVMLSLIPYLLLAAAILGYLVSGQVVAARAPGDTLVELQHLGVYEIWYEYEGTIDGKPYQASPSLAAWKLGLIDLDSSRPIELSSPAAPETRVFGERKALLAASFALSGGGRLQFSAAGGRPQVLFSIEETSYAQTTEHLQQFVKLNFPQLQESLKSMIEGVAAYWRGLGLVGFLGLLWTSRSLVFSVSFALDTIHGAPAEKPIWRKLVDTAVVVCLASLLITASVFFSIVLAWVSRKTGWHVDEGYSLRTLSFPFSAFVSMIIFLAFYQILPQVRPSWFHSLIGATVGALIWEFLKLLLIGYFAFESDKYAAIYGTLAVGVYVILWAYFFATGVLIGACAAWRLETERKRASYVAE